VYYTADVDTEEKRKGGCVMGGGEMERRDGRGLTKEDRGDRRTDRMEEIDKGS